MRALLLAACLLLVPASISAAPDKTIAVDHAHVVVSDLVPGASAEIAAIEVGAAPAMGVVRAFSRSEIEAAIKAKGATPPKDLPALVKVSRKVDKVPASDVEKSIRAAIAKSPLRKGATVTAIRAPKSVDVPAGGTMVVELPKIPRKTGTLATSAIVTWMRGDEQLAKQVVAMDVALSADAALPDCAAKSSVTLVVRKGVIEISAPGTAAADADIGDALPVVVKATGHVVKAKLLAKDRALAITEQ